MPFASRLAAACVAALVIAGGAAAHDAAPAGRLVSIVDTPGPGGPFGTNGFDIFNQQAQAQRFTVPADGGDVRLGRVGMYLMNNSDTEHPLVIVAVQTDAVDEGGNDSMPSGRSLETWKAPVETLGWNPVQQFFPTVKGPRLVAGRNYWVVVASHAPALVDPVWTFARKGIEFGSSNHGDGWWAAVSQGALTLQVDVLPLK